MANHRRVSYTVGFTLPTDFEANLQRAPKQARTEPYNSEGQVRDGTWVSDVTALLDLTSSPGGMRIIIRKERPHPSAQLRITDIDGNRVTANTPEVSYRSRTLKHG